MATVNNSNTTDTTSYQSERLFCYGAVKEVYMRQLIAYYKGKRIYNADVPWSQNSLDKIIVKLNQANILKKRQRPLNDELSRLEQKYEVWKNENKENVLILKRICSDAPILQALSIEKSFDLLIKIHLETDHGDASSILRLTSRYIYPKYFVKVLLQNCNVCLQNRNTKQGTRESVVFNECGQMLVLKMDMLLKNSSDHLLICVDKLTNFTILRPLMDNSETEVAMEIFKIFTEFGSPDLVNVYGLNSQFYRQVFKIVKDLLPNHNIMWTFQETVYSSIIIPVIRHLREWMVETDSKSWDIGCYIVQQRINNAKTMRNMNEVAVEQDKERNSNLSPLNMVFGKAIYDGSDSSDDSDAEIFAEFNEHNVFKKTSNTNLHVETSSRALEAISQSELSVQESQATSSKTVPLQETFAETEDMAYSIEILSDSDHGDKEECNTDASNPTKPFVTAVCNVCSAEIIRVLFTCNKCDLPMHLFCGERSTLIINSKAVLVIICNKCKEKPTETSN